MGRGNNCIFFIKLISVFVAITFINKDIVIILSKSFLLMEY